MGPMPGPKMIAASADAETLESEALRSLNLNPEAFHNGKRTPGTRRKMLEFPQETSVHQTEDGMLLRFDLPAGSYATVLLREIAETLIQP